MAVGTHKGFVQIWDAAAGKKLSMLEGHTARVGEEPPGGKGGGVLWVFSPKAIDCNVKI